MLAGLDRLSTVNNMGDNFSNYFQDSTNWAIFTHNIFNITDNLEPHPGLPLHQREQGLRGRFQQHQHGLPGPAGRLRELPDGRRDAAAGATASGALAPPAWST